MSEELRLAISKTSSFGRFALVNIEYVISSRSN